PPPGSGLPPGTGPGGRTRRQFPRDANRLPTGAGLPGRRRVLSHDRPVPPRFPTSLSPVGPVCPPAIVPAAPASPQVSFPFAGAVRQTSRPGAGALAAAAGPLRRLPVRPGSVRLACPVLPALRPAPDAAQ